MKLSFLIFLFCLLCVHAQRRAALRPDATPPSELEKPQQPRGRGRARFTTTPEFTQITEAQNDERSSTRKRVNLVAAERRPPPAVGSRAYEVQETVNESPIDPFRRQSKPRVLTETRFEARGTPKKPLFEPSAEPSSEPPIDELLKQFGSNLADTNNGDLSATTIKQDTPQNIDVTSEGADTTNNIVSEGTETTKTLSEIRKDTTKSLPESTPKTETRRRPNGRSNVVVRSRANTQTQAQTSSDSTTPASRPRTGRTRATRKPDATIVTPAPTPRTVRVGRRRLDSPPNNIKPRTETTSDTIKSRAAPSVLAAEETQDLPVRSRTGRRISNRVEQKSPEKITIDIDSRENTVRGRQFSSRGGENSSSANLRRTSRPRFTSRENLAPVDTKPTKKPLSRSHPTLVRKTLRSRTRVTTTTPVYIDEQKLEVLPLFETEAKTVLPPTPTKKSFSSRESVETSASENAAAPKPNDISSRVTVSHRVETRRKTYFRQKTTKKPQIKETVVAEVSEVTSRSTSRRRNNDIPVDGKSRVKVDAPKVSISTVVSRGRRKGSAKNSSKLTSSEEEIEDTDNYPEPFKALIQAKKNKKESRPTVKSHSSGAAAKSVTNDEKIVSTSAPSTTETPTRITTTTQATTSSTTEAIKETLEVDNEILPKVSTTAPSFRPTRKRFGKPSEKTTSRRQYNPSRHGKFTRSTTSAPPDDNNDTRSVRKEHRFHAKFNSASKSESGESDKKPPRGLYSSRKNAQRGTKTTSEEPAIDQAQISKNSAIPKKSNRFSSKYRGDTSFRGSALRSTTNAPAYVPTIPTAAYVPTIPTLQPPTTENVWSEDRIIDWQFSRLY